MRIGVVSKTNAVTFAQLERACAAISRQLMDVRAAWNLPEDITIEPCRSRSDPGNISYVTVSANPLFLSAFSAPAEGNESHGVTRQTSGEHGVIAGNSDEADRSDRPYAQVRYVEDRAEDHRWWTVTLSHECVEMAVNPYMDRAIPGPPLRDFVAAGHAGEGETVDFLKEICDPCQSGLHAYPCDLPGSDQPIWLSDFVLPEYFNPQAQGARLSFTGSVTRPREILAHGCLTWGLPRTKKLWQQWRFEDGTLSDFICVRDWQPGSPSAAKPDPHTSTRHSLYGAQPDYKMHRIPDLQRVADVLRQRKPS